MSASSTCTTHVNVVMEEILLSDSDSDELEVPLPPEKRFKTFFPGHDEIVVKELARATKYSASRIVWKFFNTYNSMCDNATIVAEIIVKYHLARFYIGVTTSPLWRMTGKANKQFAEDAAEKKKMIPHAKNYDVMFVLTALDACLAAHHETHLIRAFEGCSAIENKSRGGERIPKDTNMCIFVYVAGSYAM